MNELLGRVAVVTGASRGIGRAIALSLAQAGCDIAVCYQRANGEADEVVQAVRGLKRKAIKVRADVADPHEARRLVREAEQLGPIGVIVNNAGINSRKPLAEITTDDWAQTIDTNLSSAFHVSQAAFPG